MQCHAPKCKLEHMLQPWKSYKHLHSTNNLDSTETWLNILTFLKMKKNKPTTKRTTRQARWSRSLLPCKANREKKNVVSMEIPARRPKKTCSPLRGPAIGCKEKHILPVSPDRVNVGPLTSWLSASSVNIRKYKRPGKQNSTSTNRWNLAWPADVSFLPSLA